MKDRKLKIVTGISSLILLISLLIVLSRVPGGIVLSGFFIGCMIIVGVMIGCLLVGLILKSIFRNYSFLTIYSILTAVCFIALHYYFYSPTLRIVVPKGYVGPVNLVLSNVDKNKLVLDSNGIGYINKWTFEKTYTEPIVTETDGTKINDRCVGFNPSTFWGKGYSTISESNIKIHSISFEIVPADKKGQKQYYDKGLHAAVDTSLLSGIK